jgi:hypothetical protein
MTMNMPTFVIQACVLLFSAKARAEVIGQPCDTDSAKMLHKYFLCSRHFAESDFRTSERVCIDTVGVPHGSDSSSHSSPQPPQPLLHIPLLNSLPTLVSVDHKLHVLPPTKTYSKASLSSCTEVPTPVHTGSPSVSTEISPFQTPPQVNTFAEGEVVDGIAISVSRISIP